MTKYTPYFATQENLQETVDKVVEEGNIVIGQHAEWSETKGAWQHFLMTMEKPQDFPRPTAVPVEDNVIRPDFTPQEDTTN